MDALSGATAPMAASVVSRGMPQCGEQSVQNVSQQCKFAHCECAQEQALHETGPIAEADSVCWSELK